MGAQSIANILPLTHIQAVCQHGSSIEFVFSIRNDDHVTKALFELNTPFCVYHISSIRRHGYYFFRFSFCAATIRGRHLFLWKAWRHQLWLDKVGTSETMTVARHCQQYAQLLSQSCCQPVGMTRTTQTVLALVW